MTTVEMRQVETAKPGRPWRATPRERAFAIGNFIAAFLLAFVLVKFTGLNGKLGWVFGFFFSYISISFVAEYVRSGKPAAQDSLLTSVSRFAVFIAIIPIASI